MTTTVARIEADANGHHDTWQITVLRHPEQEYVLAPRSDDLPGDVQAALIAWLVRGREF